MIIRTTRFYKPTLAKLTRAERMFGSELFKRGSAEFDFLASGLQHSMMNRRVAMQYNNRASDFEPSYFDMGPFQITYNFPSSIRNNVLPGGTYGASGWSHRMLYEFLCERFNSGVPFVDTYFDRVFKSRIVYKKFLEIYDEIRDRINNELYDRYLRGEDRDKKGRFKSLGDAKVWQDSIIKQSCKDLAREIRNDIVVCLYSGIIPVSRKEGPVVSAATERQRVKIAGMRHPNRLFFATGELIRHLNIYVLIAQDADVRGRAA